MAGGVGEMGVLLCIGGKILRKGRFLIKRGSLNCPWLNLFNFLFCYKIWSSNIVGDSVWEKRDFLKIHWIWDLNKNKRNQKKRTKTKEIKKQNKSQKNKTNLFPSVR